MEVTSSTPPSSRVGTECSQFAEAAIADYVFSDQKPTAVIDRELAKIIEKDYAAIKRESEQRQLREDDVALMARMGNASRGANKYCREKK
ncbi:hypothetical protein [Winkia neuii]|uniref:Uncharacterized protein n=1 Tax=Winkia neuii BV029A5 TaxID=888439 RepID=K0YN86_9ACTO|nr:hypothetical protein [Winkia neuii]EJZ85112.1 hypothetical protein HMPREF9240_01599 [Winkia neuii BV029A5]PMC94227.1 hypothetical protein CJ188_03120 [Actinomyces sp. UMB0918]WEB56909.1 hypothetical protein PUW65_00115 [Winkia neuii]